VNLNAHPIVEAFSICVSSSTNPQSKRKNPSKIHKSNGFSKLNIAYQAMPGDINSNRCHGVYCEIHEPGRFVGVEFAAFGAKTNLHQVES